MTAKMIYEIAVASKIDKLLFYTADNLIDGNQKGAAPLKTGTLVKVPLAKRLVTGVVIKVRSTVPNDLVTVKLKSIQSVLPASLWLTSELRELIIWCSRYYHQPIGKVLTTALPKALLTGSDNSLAPTMGWQITEISAKKNSAENADPFGRAARQRELYNWIKDNPLSASANIKAAGFDGTLLKKLEKRGLIYTTEKALESQYSAVLSDLTCQESKPELNADQATALKIVTSNDCINPCYLLNGVTGSGKTEIYLQSAHWALNHGMQILILVPEIGLIHQTVDRLKNRFGLPINTYTSECSESEKIESWRAARNGERAIFVGTRSAIFLPFSNLGLIVVDEEHDQSYKQQEGFRYHARDLATLRSRDLNAPLILGSATPSIESIKNAQMGAYQELRLAQRVSAKPMPDIRIVRQASHGGQVLANETLARINEEISQDSQVLVFINRRGFAPKLYCENCTWLAQCPNCDTALCKHLKPALLICHHCDHRENNHLTCPRCKSHYLSTQGLGTEQLESQLQHDFPNTRCIRIDRDTTSRKGSFKERLSGAMSGESCLLIGTQMLAKGHHLPNLSLAVIAEADQALFSHDFRAEEYLGQLITQVAGRTGRGDKAGELLIETAHPGHPMLNRLVTSSYSDYSQAIAEERRARQLPPYSYAAIIRTESANLNSIVNFMGQLATLIDASHKNSANKASVVNMIGPMPAAMERRQGRFRYQINLSCSSRKTLHETLGKTRLSIAALKGFSDVRWGIDVDPVTND